MRKEERSCAHRKIQNGAERSFVRRVRRDERRRFAEEQRSASGTKHTKACVPCTVNDTGKRPRARAFSDISFGICLDLTSWARELGAINAQCSF